MGCPLDYWGKLLLNPSKDDSFIPITVGIGLDSHSAIIMVDFCNWKFSFPFGYLLWLLILPISPLCYLQESTALTQPLTYPYFSMEQIIYSCGVPRALYPDRSVNRCR